MAAAKKPTRKIIDVAHPGKTAASPTSKPVIVTNRPILRDPMVNETADSTEEKEKSQVLAATSGKPAIKPLTAPEIKEEGGKTIAQLAAEAKSDKKSDSTAAGVKLVIPDLEESKEEPKEEEAKPEESEASEDKSEENPEPETSEDQKPQDESGQENDEKTDAEPEESDDDTSTDESANDSISDAPNQSKDPGEADAKKAAEEEKKDKAEQELIDSKKYFLPINSVEKRRTKRVVAAGVLLCLLLIVAWADVVLDAGLISNPSNLPHTHLFSAQTIEPAPVPAPVASATKAAPKTQLQTFTSTIDNLSFKYPNDWVVDATNTAGSDEQQWVHPKGSTAENTAASAMLSRNLDATKSPLAKPVTLVKVAYTAMPKAGSKTLYLREITYKNQDSKSFYLYLSVTDQRAALKAGDKISQLKTNFMAADGKTTMVFEGDIGSIKNNQDQPGFILLTAAQKYQSGTEYQKVKKALLSLKLSN